MANGMFRYDLSEIVTRHVPGNYGFIVQCNPKRHTHRRAPAQMSSLRQPFDPTLFNFNSIKPGEVRKPCEPGEEIQMSCLCRSYLSCAGFLNAEA